MARACLAVQFAEVKEGNVKRTRKKRKTPATAASTNPRAKDNVASGDESGSDDDGAADSAELFADSGEADRLSDLDFLNFDIDERQPGADQPAPWRQFLPPQEDLEAFGERMRAAMDASAEIFSSFVDFCA